MILNSKKIKCSDASMLRTCSICFERPMFFSEEDLNAHYEKNHAKNENKSDETLTFLTQQLKVMEKSKNKLFYQLQEIKDELSSLSKHGCANKRTTNIVQKEVVNLQKQISVKENDIQIIRSKIDKEKNRHSKFDHSQIMAAFKETLDAEYSILRKTMGIGAFFRADESESSISGVESSSETHSTEERLTRLEAEVKQLKKQSIKQTVIDVGNNNDEDLMKKCALLQKAFNVKEEELKACNECIEKLKVVFTEKENEVKLLKEMKGKQKEFGELQSIAKAAMEEQLKELFKEKNEIDDENKGLTDELKEAIKALTSAENKMMKLTKEKEDLGVQGKFNEDKIVQMSADIIELKKKPPKIDHDDCQKKLQMLEEQLTITNKDLGEKKLILEKQNDEYDGKMSSLRDEIECLLKEKDELFNLVQDMKSQVIENQQLECDYQRKLATLQTELQALLQKNEYVSRQMIALEAQLGEREEVVYLQTHKIENLELDKRSLEKQLKKATVDKESVQQELVVITKKHGKCKEELTEMQQSYDDSIEDMRNQMGCLLREESELSTRLECELKVKEKFHQEEKIDLENKILASQSLTEELEKELEAGQREHHKCQLKIEQLQKERENLQDKLEGVQKDLEGHKATSLDDKQKIVDLQNALEKSNVIQEDTDALMQEKQAMECLVNDLQEQLYQEEEKVAEMGGIVSEMESHLVELQQQHQADIEELKCLFEKERVNFRKELDDEKCRNQMIVQDEQQINTIRSQSDEEKQNLKNQLKETQQLLMEERNKTEKLTNEKNQVEKLLTNLKEENEDISGHKSILEEKIEAFHRDYEKQKTDYETGLSSLKLEMDELHAKAKAVSAKEKNLEKDYAKLKTENERMMLDLFHKNEQEKISKEKMNCLQQKLEELESVNIRPGKEITDLESQLKSSQEKIVELSKSLFEVQQNYNDSVVDHDLVCKKFKNTEKDSNGEIANLQNKLKESKANLDEIREKLVNEDQQKVEIRNRLENTKVQLTNKIDEIEKVLTERKEIEQRLTSLDQLTENLKTNEKKLRDKLHETELKNEDLEGKLSKAEKDLQMLKETLSNEGYRINNEEPSSEDEVEDVDHHGTEAIVDVVKCVNEVTGHRESKDGGEDLRSDEYSSSFDDNSTTTNSDIHSSSVSLRDDSCGTTSTHSSKNKDERERIRDDRSLACEIVSEKDITEEIHSFLDDKDLLSEDDTRSGQDEEAFTDDDDFYGTQLTRKQTVAKIYENIDNNINADEIDDEEEHSDVIPKRKWGENFLNGIEQTIEEELGEQCEESIASVDDFSSIKDAKEIKLDVKETKPIPGSLSETGVIDSIYEVEKSLDIGKDYLTSTFAADNSTNNTEIKSNKIKSNEGLPLRTTSDSDSSFINSDSEKINKSDKKKKSEKGKKGSKKKKSTESLSPLKGDLPPLKSKSSLGELLPLRGLPGVRRIEVKSMAELSEQGTDATRDANLLEEVASESSMHDDHASIFQTEGHLKQVKSQASKLLIREGQCGDTQQQTKPAFDNLQMFSPKYQRKNSFLSDLPPLSCKSSKPSVVNTTENVFNNNNDDVNDCSFEIDDIDALLQDLDEFDAKKSLT